jgi:hypothetical protein
MQLKLISIMIFFMLALVATVVMQCERIKTVTTERDQAIDFKLSSEKKLQEYVNKQGEATKRTDVVDLTDRNAKKLSESKELNAAKKFKGVKKNFKNVDGVIKIDAEGSINLALPSKYSENNFLVMDTAGMFFRKAHEWKSLYPIVLLKDSFNTVVQTEDSLKVRMIVPLDGALLWHRKWFLGRRHWTFDVSTPNKLVNITGLEYIRIGKE